MGCDPLPSPSPQPTGHDNEDSSASPCSPPITPSNIPSSGPSHPQPGPSQADNQLRNAMLRMRDVRRMADAELIAVEAEMLAVMQRIVQMESVWGKEDIAAAAVEMGISRDPPQ